MKKVILITGASRGIGAATAWLAAARSYAVCVNYRINRAAADWQAIAVAALETDVVGLSRTVARRLGTLTALVNNAGGR